MTAHGAYTKAMQAARHARGYAHDASKNIKALTAALPLPEDPKLIAELNTIAEAFKALTESLATIKDQTHALATAYLEQNATKVTKPYELSRGGPSIRLRLKSKREGR